MNDRTLARCSAAVALIALAIAIYFAWTVHQVKANLDLTAKAVTMLASENKKLADLSGQIAGVLTGLQREIEAGRRGKDDAVLDKYQRDIDRLRAEVDSK